MASGFVQRFKGKIVAQVLHLGAGGIVDAASGIAGKANVTQRIALPVTAVANTDFTISLPPGAVVMSARVYTTTAYGAATDATIQLGSAAGGSQYVAAASIKAVGVAALTLVNAAAAGLASFPSGSPNLFARIVQTGAASATGAATLVVEYSAP